MWWEYNDNQKAKFVKENEWLLHQPVKYIVGQSLAFGLLAFLFQVVYFTFFTEDQTLHWIKWIAFFFISGIAGGLYGTFIHFINKYYIQKFRSDLCNK